MTKSTEMKANINNVIEEHPFILGIPSLIFVILGLMMFIGIFIWSMINGWNAYFPHSSIFR
jgi:hypothetical protein